MYEDRNDFRAIKSHVDPERTLESNFARRLQHRGE
jgi:hypothetical protein